MARAAEPGKAVLMPLRLRHSTLRILLYQPHARHLFTQACNAFHLRVQTTCERDQKQRAERVTGGHGAASASSCCPGIIRNDLTQAAKEEIVGETGLRHGENLRERDRETAGRELVSALAAAHNHN